MKKLYKCLLAALLLASIVLPMGGCRPESSANQGNSQGSGQTNNQGSGNNSQSGSGNAEEQPHYSDILYTVLTESYYLSLSELPTGQITITSQKRRQNPFGYLKQEGYNLEDYLSEELEVQSDVYIKGDDTSNLYIATRAESKHEQGNYYTCYVLQYELTEQEYADLEMLHKKNYVQAPLFIQELSYQKQPVSVNKASISKKSYEYMEDVVKSYYNVFRNKTFQLDFLGYDTSASENYSFTFAVRCAPYTGSIMIDDAAELRYLITDVPELKGPLNTYGNNVFYGTRWTMGSNIHQEEYEKSQPITYFESDHFTTRQFMLPLTHKT